MTKLQIKGRVLPVVLALMLALNGVVFSQPAQAQGKLVPIKIKPLSDTYPVINSLRLQFEIAQDGKSVGTGSGGIAVKGNVFAKIDVNNQKEQRRTTLGGSLLVQQLKEGYPPGTQVSVLNFGSDAYVLLEADKATCQKSDDDGFTKQIDSLRENFDKAVNELVTALSQSKTPIASLVGDETVNGIDVQHYVVDSASPTGKPFLEGLNKNGDQFKQARVDVWTATEGSYLVKLELKGTGKTQLTGASVDGKLSFSVSYSDINKKVEITLPKSCQSATAAPSQSNGTTTSADATPIDSYKNVKQATVRIVARGTFWELGADEAVTDEWSGSGFIIDPSGLAVTNNHVAVAADSLQAYVGGEVIPRNVKVIARNECADIALIKISGKNFPFLAWNEDEIDAGLDVYAAGFPLGDPEFTLTRGIVSKGRANGNTAISGIEYRIEHDATINPGSSGGPLVNVDGRVVGVNAAQNKEARQSFAAPASIVLEMLDALKDGKDVDAIGILPRAVLSQFASGIWVSSVQKDSLAAEAGMQPGDVITSLNGEALVEEETLEIFCRVLREKAGEPMAIEVTRLATGEALAGELSGDALSVSGKVDGGKAETNTSDELVNVEIVNDASEAVAKIYIVSPEADDWGDNLLEGDPIEPGSRTTLKVRKGVFDFKPTNADDAGLGALYRLELDEGTELTVTGVAGLPKGAKKAFEDKFDKLRKDVWAPAKSEETEMKISEGEYCMAVNKPGWSIWDVTKTTFSKNFSAEVRCSVDPAGGLCAMGFGADLDNHYWLSLTPDKQTVVVFEKRKGEWTADPVIESTQSFAIKPTGSNFMGVDRVNGKLFVYVNGRLLGEAPAAKFNTPRIVLGGGTHEGDDSAKACLDELTVWNIK